jgi:thymidine kinase
MAKLYFYYSTMNAGKSTAMLQASHNYHERGMRTLMYTAKLDDRGGGKVHSRIGISGDALHFLPGLDLREQIEAEHQRAPLACVLVDESQFLEPAQVKQLAAVVDELNVPVLCYGLRTDFRGELFAGSAQLLAWADNLVELKTICHCGRKATMVVRVGADGSVEREGAQVEIGGNERYVPLCRRHFLSAVKGSPLQAR